MTSAQLRQHKTRLEALETQDVRAVVARCTSDSGQSIPDNAFTVVDYATVEFDPRSAVTTGASWAFTAPLAGYYQVSAMVSLVGSSAWETHETLRLAVYVNGVQYARLFYHDVYNDGSNPGMVAGGGTLVRLNKGDALDILVFQNSDSAIALASNTLYNWVSVARIGG